MRLRCLDGAALLAVVTAALVATAAPGTPRAAPEGPVPARQPGERIYARLKDSVLTVEVHPLSGETKSTLGSGYVAADGGRIVTNYHVVGDYVLRPDRYRLLVKSGSVSHPATLLGFDVINDLALLRAAIPAPPLKLAPSSGQAGASIVAFGNPQGLGLSLVHGVFNGFAEKGFIDRMLLSMPLNSGMSGGPILDARNEVVGTNVSVYRDSDSLSFGVPVENVHQLLVAPALGSGEAALQEQTQRQLALLEERAFTRAVRPLMEGPLDLVGVGAAQVPRLPEVFECWNSTHDLDDAGIHKTSFRCNLQFTPSLADVGEVGSLEVLSEHFTSQRSRFGFYGGLTAHGAKHHGVEPRAPGNGLLSRPQCRTDRVRTDHLVFKVTTCSYAYVRHPGLGYFALSATSTSLEREAVYVAAHGSGVRLETFLALVRSFLGQVRMKGA